MSTKIFNAYLYKKSPAALMRHIMSYRKLWRECQVNRLVQLVKDLKYDASAELHKTLYPDGDILNVGDLEKLIKEDTKKVFKSAFDIWDISGSVVVYFHGKKTLVQTFLEGAYGSKPPKFVNKDMVDYHYQNQTDPYFDYMKPRPTGAKLARMKRDWSERKRVWDDIFNDSRSFSEAGLTHEMVSDVEITLILMDVLEKLKKE